jgi:hypothetical protein
MANSNEYEAAYQAHNEACKVYRELSRKHLAFEITSEEYMIGRRIYDEATKVYDAAFDKEASRAA